MVYQENSSHTTKPSSSTVPEIAKRHMLGVATVWRAVNSGKLKAIKIGRSTRVTSDDENEWLRSHKRRITNQSNDPQ